MKHDQNKINLDPILFPMSFFLLFATLGKPICLRSVGLALGKRDNPKVVCLNALFEVWFCFRQEVKKVPNWK